MQPPQGPPPGYGPPPAYPPAPGYPAAPGYPGAGPAPRQPGPWPNPAAGHPGPGHPGPGPGHQGPWLPPPPALSPTGQPLASFADRLLAYLIDIAIFVGVSLVLAVPVFAIFF
ncbi:MAG TPA: hypothetical protein VNP20_25030, partial [Nocardioidaceae bacterium]|nr:hypothetical protein [Nocardioidaceae bacterium]